MFSISQLEKSSSFNFVLNHLVEFNIHLSNEVFLKFLLIYNRVVDKMKVVYPFYESVIIKKPKKVNV